MDEADEMLIEEVRKYDHLYNASSRHYKDSQMARNSWKEIAENTGLEVSECMKKWKNLRQKYVRVRRRMSTRRDAPAFYHLMSWLTPNVKHRKTHSNYVEKVVLASTSTDEGESSSSASWSSRSSTPDLLSPSASPVSAAPPALSVALKSRPKRKRDQTDDLLLMYIAKLEEERQELKQSVDVCTRFGQTVAELLRQVPEDRRVALMLKIQTTIHEWKG
ncbi:transcription factor Adf-1-like [Corythoichthys intestinalis]|uniref:transcription factor Adf-1-like n=1 Tax=Corythoichthys intestinalis TaxID=161448 RepID=UPI0025A57D5D|nr:transcription factor Adf-1-like [Corythoichthys intestinalis]